MPPVSLEEAVTRLAPVLGDLNLNAFQASTILAVIFEERKHITLDKLVQARCGEA